MANRFNLLVDPRSRKRNARKGWSILPAFVRLRLRHHSLVSGVLRGNRVNALEIAPLARDVPHNQLLWLVPMSASAVSTR